MFTVASLFPGTCKYIPPFDMHAQEPRRYADVDDTDNESEGVHAPSTQGGAGGIFGLFKGSTPQNYKQPAPKRAKASEAGIGTLYNCFAPMLDKSCSCLGLDRSIATYSFPSGHRATLIKDDLPAAPLSNTCFIAPETSYLYITCRPMPPPPALPWLLHLCDHQDLANVPCLGA